MALELNTGSQGCSTRNEPAGLASDHVVVYCTKLNRDKAAPLPAATRDADRWRWTEAEGAGRPEASTAGARFAVAWSRLEPDVAEAGEAESGVLAECRQS
jgi:hypothetical protein